MKNKVGRLLRFLFSKQAISESLSWGLDRNRGKMRPYYSTRNDLQTISICEGARLEVYWKKQKGGIFPAVSFFILDEEILRIDCSGKDTGHMHACFFLPSEDENRIFLPEDTMKAQVDRAHFELCRNFRYYQARVPNPKIRAFKIDSGRMTEVSEQARAIMTGFLQAKSVLNEVEVSSVYDEA
jgi:hypothetical protein